MEKTIYSQLQLLGLAYRQKKPAVAARDEKRTNPVRELPKGHSAIRDAIIVLLATKDEPDKSEDGQADRHRSRADISKALAEFRKVRSR